MPKKVILIPEVFTIAEKLRRYGYTRLANSVNSANGKPKTVVQHKPKSETIDEKLSKFKFLLEADK